METLGQDLRYAYRMLRRAPGFALVVLATMALCIGANTAVFAVVHASLMRALPYPDADAIFFADEQAPGLYMDWRQDATTVSAIAAFRQMTADVTGFDRPERLEGAVVTASFFDVMGVRPALGRALAPGDEQAGARVIVLADSYWQRRFAADPRAVGASMTLDGEKYTIVGVMPRGFSPPIDAQAWVPPRHLVPEHPLRPGEDVVENRGSHYLGVCGRLKPGVPLRAAQAEQRVIFDRARSRHPDDVLPEDVNVRLVPWREYLVGDVQPALVVLLAAVALVLLVGCANIANVMLARSTARRQEIGVRAALGAGRGRLVRQLLTESLFLSTLGGALGALTAAWMLPSIIALAPQAVRDTQVSMNVPVLMFALAASLVAGVIFGCVPAIHAAGTNLASTLAAGHRTTEGRRGRLVRDGLTVAEIAVSLALLTGAGLMIRSFVELRRVDPGFNPSGLQTARIDLPSARYDTPARQALFFDQLIETVGRAPGITGAAAAARLPFAGGNSTRSIALDRASAEPQPAAGIRVVSADYFSVMAIPLLRGRAFTRGDRAEGPPVAIVNAVMAERYWPGDDVVGRRFRVGDGPWIEIVGLAGNVRHGSLREPPDPEFYLPFQQAPWSFMTIVVKTPLGADAVSAALTAGLATLDAALVAPSVQPMTALLGRSTALDRFEMAGLMAFAGIALALATVGLYGVMAYLVGRRTRELGLRLALGASPGRIMSSVVLDGLRLVAAGMAVGAVLAGAVSQALRGTLYGVSATDPATFAAVAALLAVVAVAATAIPARRAMLVDPAVALRAE